MSSISSVSPVSPTMMPSMQTVQPAPATQQGGNNVTYNIANQVQAPGWSSGNQIAITNVLDIQGSNNNITINEYNDIIIGAQAANPAQGGITPVNNSDGSISFKYADGTQATLQEYLAALLQSLVTNLTPPQAATNQAGAYQTASNLGTTPSRQENGSAVDKTI